jgi:hypothetical protein
MAKTSGRARKGTATGVKRRHGGGVPESLKLPEIGLVQSLLIKGQRLQLDELGRRVGTPVVYLKAAWADPVLYGGRGERGGTDIDILVHPSKFVAYARALADCGFKRHEHGSPAYESYFGHKEWAFQPPDRDGPSFGVDLHRALTEPVWFDLPAEGLIARSTEWQSIDGPILSLCPEDQILYGAAHYANHDYDLDARHLVDCLKLVMGWPIDWETTWQRAERAKLRLPLMLLVEALEHRGWVPPPAARRKSSALLTLRRLLASRWINTVPELRRRTARSRGLDYLILKPLLSDRATALPQIAATYGVPWLRERLAQKMNKPGSGEG